VELLMYQGGAAGYKTRMVSVGVSERALCPWLGGSIVASLGSFHEVWVTRQEYNECGTSIIDRKCP
jgi:actin-related protein